MTWRYKILGSHTHVAVFLNGAKCGDLCFRNEEFEEILKSATPAGYEWAVPIITFVEEEKT